MFKFHLLVPAVERRAGVKPEKIGQDWCRVWSVEGSGPRGRERVRRDRGSAGSEGWVSGAADRAQSRRTPLTINTHSQEISTDVVSGPG